jgi:hypothetical protein
MAHVHERATAFIAIRVLEFGTRIKQTMRVLLKLPRGSNNSRARGRFILGAVNDSFSMFPLVPGVPARSRSFLPRLYPQDLNQQTQSLGNIWRFQKLLARRQFADKSRSHYIRQNFWTIDLVHLLQQIRRQG